MPKLSTHLSGEMMIDIESVHFFFCSFMVLLTKYDMHKSCLFIVFAVQLGIGIGDSGGQLGCSFHNGFVVPGGDIVSNLSTVRFVAHQQHLKLLDVVD